MPYSTRNYQRKLVKDADSGTKHLLAVDAVDSGNRPEDVWVKISSDGRWSLALDLAEAKLLAMSILEAASIFEK